MEPWAKAERRGRVEAEGKRGKRSAIDHGTQTDVGSTGQRRRRGRPGGSAARRGAGKKRAGRGGEHENSRSPARFSPAMRQSVMEPWRSGAPRESGGRRERGRRSALDHGTQTDVGSTGERRRRGCPGGSAARRGAGKKRAGNDVALEFRRSTARFSRAARQSVMEPWAKAERRGRVEAGGREEGAP